MDAPIEILNSAHGSIDLEHVNYLDPDAGPILLRQFQVSADDVRPGIVCTEIPLTPAQLRHVGLACLAFAAEVEARAGQLVLPLGLPMLDMRRIAA
jgi:hypothetical protein